MNWIDPFTFEDEADLLEEDLRSYVATLHTHIESLRNIIKDQEETIEYLESDLLERGERNEVSCF